MKIVNLLTLLLLYAGDSPSLRLTAKPQTGFAPQDVEIRVFLNGTEREVAVALYDTDGFLLRSSAQDLMGDTLIYLKWRRVGICTPCTLTATTSDSKGHQETKSLDLHYLE